MVWPIVQQAGLMTILVCGMLMIFAGRAWDRRLPKLRRQFDADPSHDHALDLQRATYVSLVFQLLYSLMWVFFAGTVLLGAVVLGGIHWTDVVVFVAMCAFGIRSFFPAISEYQDLHALIGRALEEQ